MRVHSSLLQSLVGLIFVLSCYAAPDAKAPTKTPAQLKRLSDEAIIAGNLKEAISLLNQLVDVEPTASNYFRRSSVHLRQRKYSDVVNDLNQAIKLDPKFLKALLQRAKMHKMRGECQAAITDYQAVLAIEPNNAQAAKDLQPLQRCVSFITSGDQFFARGNFKNAKDHYTSALDLAPESFSLLLKRSQCDEKLGDFQSILLDTRRILQVDENHNEALIIRGNAYYMIGEIEAALSHLRRLLKFDPEHVKAKAQYKKLRLYNNHISNGDEAMNQQQFKDAVESFQSALEVEPSHPVLTQQVQLKLCRAYVKAKQGREAVDICTKILDADSNNIDAWKFRAQAHSVLEDYQQSLNDWQKAAEINQQDGEVQQGIQNAQLELKKAQRKNYYKILGVTKTASASEIKKAFRALALKWHPDKNPPDDREKCEKMFRDIGEAYEVLSNEESRRKYDNGEDIQAEQGFNPHQHFQQGGFPFGGGQHFTFTFG